MNQNNEIEEIREILRNLDDQTLEDTGNFLFDEINNRHMRRHIFETASSNAESYRNMVSHLPPKTIRNGIVGPGEKVAINSVVHQNTSPHWLKIPEEGPDNMPVYWTITHE